MKLNDQIKQLQQRLLRWLRREYQLNVFNYQTLAETKNFQFSNGKALLIAIGSISGVMLLTMMMIFFTPLREWAPGYTDSDYIRKQNELIMMVDSLDHVAARQDTFIKSLQRMTGAANPTANLPSASPSQTNTTADNASEEAQTPVALAALSPAQFSLLRRPMESLAARLIEGYNPASNHYAVDFAAPEGSTIQSVADGFVLVADYTYQNGYTLAILHRNGLVSVYKHCSRLLKKTGNFAYAGETIAIIGNTGENTSGPHLHFELWQDGKPANPNDYLTLQ
jgi:hypothetical protein